MKRNFVALVLMLALCTRPLIAQSSSSIEAQVLAKPFRDVGTLAVLVESLGPDARKAGVSEDELKAFVELKLRQAGITVRDIGAHSLESPYVYVNINLMYHEQIDHLSYSARISLQQTVRLLRNDSTLTAGTWEKESIAIVRREKAHGHIKDTVDTLLTFFLNSYLSANPKNTK